MHSGVVKSGVSFVSVGSVESGGLGGSGGSGMIGFLESGKWLDKVDETILKQFEKFQKGFIHFI